MRAGEIHALLGQNGAGKSTLVKILNGVHPAGAFTGEIVLAGQPVSFASPADAAAAGIVYVPQEIEVLEQLTVAENVFAGRTGLGQGILVNRRALETRTRAIFADLGLPMDPRAIVASLTSAQRHLVMIARALSNRPRVLMLDEPTASLSGTEVAALFGVLRRLKAQGVTMIYITHRLPEVLAICDRATVLRDGQVAAEIARPDFDADRFIFSMSGQRLNRLFPDHSPPAEPRTALEVRGLTVAGHPGAIFGARDVSFSVAAGEIVGLAGLLGSGRSEILHGIYGRIPAQGEIRVEGRPVAIRSPRDARRAGIALLTEDRKRDGLLFNLPVGANITIGNLGDFSRTRSHQRRARAQRHPRRHARAQRQGRLAAGLRCAPLRRQPAEAPVRPRADARPPGAPPRRAHQGRRCLDPRRDLPPRHRARRTRASRSSSSPPSSRS